jgi:hypothetical protein
MKKGIVVLVIISLTVVNVAFFANSGNVDLFSSLNSLKKIAFADGGESSTPDCSLCSTGNCDCWVSCNGGESVYCPNSSCIKVS